MHRYCFFAFILFPSFCFGITIGYFHSSFLLLSPSQSRKGRRRAAACFLSKRFQHRAHCGHAVYAVASLTKANYYRMTLHKSTLRVIMPSTLGLFNLEWFFTFCFLKHIIMGSWWNELQTASRFSFEQANGNQNVSFVARQKESQFDIFGLMKAARTKEGSLRKFASTIELPNNLWVPTGKFSAISFLSITKVSKICQRTFHRILFILVLHLTELWMRNINDNDN